MNAGRVTIDTNVLVYAVDGKAGDRHVRALNLVDAAVDWDSVLVLQVLNEFFAVTTGKGKLDPAEAATSVDEWLRLFPVHAAGPGTLRHAMAAVREHRLSFWDAMLWATAREAGCGILLTEDFQHGRVLGGVRFHNPFLESGPMLPPE